MDPNVPDDFDPSAVQAAMYVVRTDDTIDLNAECGRIMLDLDFTTDGDSMLADGKYAGTMYQYRPYLIVYTFPERDGKVNIRLSYNKRSPDELTEWLATICAKIDRKTGLAYDVYEEASTGPF